MSIPKCMMKEEKGYHYPLLEYEKIVLNICNINYMNVFRRGSNYNFFDYI